MHAKSLCDNFMHFLNYRFSFLRLNHFFQDALSSYLHGNITVSNTFIQIMSLKAVLYFWKLVEYKDIKVRMSEKLEAIQCL